MYMLFCIGLGFVLAEQYIKPLLFNAKISIDEYRKDGEYTYTKGFSYIAFAALFIGIFPNIPGFLVQINWVSQDQVPGLFKTIFKFAWISGFGISFITYIAARKLSDWRNASHLSSG